MNDSSADPTAAYPLTAVHLPAGQTLMRFAKEWHASASVATQGTALPNEADEIALACLLVVVEHGEAAAALAQPALSANAQCALSRWPQIAYGTLEAMPWDLCAPQSASDAGRRRHVASLVRFLVHPTSALRIWAMHIAWMVRPWLDRDRVVPLLLENVAGTLGGTRTAVGLARGLCRTDEELDGYISRFVSEDFAEQFAERVGQVRAEGYALSEGHLWELEARCRKRTADALLAVSAADRADGGGTGEANGAEPRLPGGPPGQGAEHPGGRVISLPYRRPIIVDSMVDGEIEVCKDAHGHWFKRRGFVSELAAKIDPSSIAGLLGLLETEDWEGLYACDREFVPWYCPVCQHMYRGRDWRTYNVFDDDGYHDQIRGTCPRGHERMLED